MRIIIADDHAVIRRGLKHILLEAYPKAFIDEASDAEEVIKKTISSTWDIVICDLSMPGRSGLDVVQHVKQHFPKLPILILSIHPEEQYAMRALKAGASGYLSKDTAPVELVKAVERVMEGKKYISSTIAEKMADELSPVPGAKPGYELLTDREFDIFKLIATGITVTDIAEKLSVSITTVSTHRTKIMNKLNLKSNAELTRYAVENNII